MFDLTDQGDSKRLEKSCFVKFFMEFIEFGYSEDTICNNINALFR